MGNATLLCLAAGCSAPQSEKHAPCCSKNHLISHRVRMAHARKKRLEQEQMAPEAPAETGTSPSLVSQSEPPLHEDAHLGYPFSREQARELVRLANEAGVQIFTSTGEVRPGIFQPEVLHPSWFADHHAETREHPPVLPQVTLSEERTQGQCVTAIVDHLSAAAIAMRSPFRLVLAVNEQGKASIFQPFRRKRR